MDALDDETLQQLYTWVDEIPLTRPKRNINRDFSDGGAFGRYGAVLPLQRLSPLPAVRTQHSFMIFAACRFARCSHAR